MYHGNLKVCKPKNLLLLPLLIIIFLHQLNITDIQIFLVFKGSCLKQKNTTYTPPSKITFFIVYELGTWSRDLHSDFTLKDCWFGGVKLAKNSDLNKYEYSGYGIEFDSHSELLLPDGSGGKNIIIFVVDMSSSVHIDNKKKDILILGIGPTQGLVDTTLTAENQYSISFSRSNRKFCLSLPYNGNNSCIFVNATRTYQLKAKDSEINKISLVFMKYLAFFG